MKIDLVKTANNKLWPANEEAVDELKKLKVGANYSAEIKLDQNYKLLQKVHVFFKYCARHYFGDNDVDKDKIDYTKKGLLISAGYFKTVVDPRTNHIEFIPLSISYGKMKEEERRECYKKLVTAACKDVFHDASDTTWNELIARFF